MFDKLLFWLRFKLIPVMEFEMRYDLNIFQHNNLHANLTLLLMNSSSLL